MSGYIFNFEVDQNALRYICQAFDSYVEKWPGGHLDEQEEIKKIQLGLHKALLDLQLLES